MGNIQKRKFGFLTTISMIVGIVIGSGIFYRTDNILKAVGGNVMMGVLAFIIGGVGIIFGGLTIASLAKRDDQVGGIITYCEMTWGKELGYLAGWFQTFFYYPALVAVIAWVAGMYTSQLFGFSGMESVFGLSTWLLTIFYLITIFVLNTLQTKNAGRFQSFAMIAKISALIILALTGLIFGHPGAALSTGTVIPVEGGLLAALVSVAFAYDGWQVAPSIAHEIKNPKRNLPLALTVAPLMILVIYVAYFLAVNAVLSPEVIALNADNAVALFATQFYGAVGAKIVLVFIITSVLGTVNGLTLGYIRLPYALALRNEFFSSKTFAKVDPKTDIPLASAILTFVVSAFWLIVHFMSLNGAMYFGMSWIGGIDISDMPIVSIFVFYIFIYIGIIKDYFKGKTKNFLEGFVFPVLAIAGAGLVVYGGFTMAKFGLYLSICFIGILAGLFFRPKRT